MLVYRIVHRMFSRSLQASGIAGRWNHAGKKVVYTAESIPLAFLENMVRRQGVGFNQDFKILVIQLPDNAVVTEIKISDLEKGWRDFNNYSKCQPSGDAWYDEGKTLILKAPSAVMTDACNYLINTEHKDFGLVQLIAATDLVPDERIEDILKKYSG